MARVPVESNVRAEALQVVAVPKIQAVQERYDPNASQAYQLANALGAAQPLADRVKERALDNEQAAALQFANSMTPDELRKKIDSGEIPMWKSPLWAATVQHVAGDNTVKGIFRDVDSQVAQGKFQTQEEMDAYIKQKRDESLAGKSAYEIAGFDKNFNQYRDRAANQQNQVITKRLENEAATVVTEDLSNGVAEITSPEMDGKSAQDKVQYILKKYEMHRTARTLNDESARSALDAVVLKLAASGNVDLVNEFMKTKLPNNGPSIETYLDVKNGQATGRSLQLRNTAETQFGQNQRENEKRLIQATNEALVNGANAKADELVSLGDGPSMTDTVLADGKLYKATDAIEGAVQRQLVANPNMPFDQQVVLYKRNAVVNPQWKREFNGAVYNLGEVTLDATGKPAGTLLKGTVEQLQKFQVVNQVSEQYAKELVGEDNYKILNKVQALQDPRGGGLELAQSAGIVNQINRRQYEPKTWGKIQKDVTTEIEEIKNPGITSKRFWSELFRGEFGEGEKNLIPIESGIRELAEAYVLAGVSNSAKEAVKKASEYMSKSVVQSNNTLYMRSDLPRVPQGEDDVKWFERYQKEVLVPRLKKMGLDPAMSDLTLIPEKGGQAMFTITNRGMPLPREDGTGRMTATHAEIEAWVKGQINIRTGVDAERADKVLKRQQRVVPPTRIIETGGGAAITSPRGVPSKE